MAGSILLAPETTYGTAPSSGWRDTGINSDNLKSRQDVLQRAVLKRNTGAPTLAGRRIIDKGGEGDLPMDVGSNGMGMYLKPAASTSSNTLVTDATTAHLQHFAWTAAGPPIGAAGASLAAEASRSRRDGTFDVWRYAGGKVLSWTLSQDDQGFLIFTPKMDFLSAQLLGSDPARTPTIPNVAFQYAWPDALITITPKDGDPDVDGNAECLSSFSLDADLKLNAEDYCLKRGTPKHEPARDGTPDYKGTLEWTYQHPRYYTAFRNGDPFTVSASWQGPVAIEGEDADAIYPSLDINLATIVFEEPNDPEAKVDARTDQSLPFIVVDDESGDPVMTWDNVTSDAAL